MQKREIRMKKSAKKEILKISEKKKEFGVLLGYVLYEGARREEK